MYISKMVLNPIQLAVISQEYYSDGHVLGRDKLYQHMINEYNVGFQWAGTLNEFDSRDDIAEWLKYQHVNTIHTRQRKTKTRGFLPVFPFHSISIDLIDYSKNGSVYQNANGQYVVYFYILVIIDNYSRFMWTIPMERKNAHVTAFHFFTWYFNVYPVLAPPAFIQMDNGGEFALIADWMGAVPGCQVIRSIPRIPASNALVERSIGSLKRILAKQIHIRHQAYIAITNTNIQGTPGAVNNPIVWQSWERELTKATEIYNDTIHLTNGFKPRIAINPLAVAPAVLIANANQNAPNPPNVKPWELHTPVRLIVPKGPLGKHDKNTFSQQVYEITRRRGLQPGRTTRYQITKLHPNQLANPGLTIGATLPHWYYKHNLNPINI